MVLRIIYHQINNEVTSPLFGGGVDYESATPYDPKSNAGLFFDDDDSNDTWNEPSLLTGSQHYHRLDDGGVDILTGGGIAPLDAISYTPSLHGIFVNEDNWSNAALVAEYIGS